MWSERRWMHAAFTATRLEKSSDAIKNVPSYFSVCAVRLPLERSRVTACRQAEHK